MNALRRLYSKENIIRFWNAEKSRFPKKTMPGVDGVTRDDFANTVQARAVEIAGRFASNSFYFQRLRPISIPKDNGKPRLINVPTITDRVVQRILLRFLVSKYGRQWKIPHSFSSMGGDDEGVHRTLESIRRRISPSDYAIKADLSRYFDTIDRKLMKEIIFRRVRDRSLHKLIGQVIDCETSTRTREERSTFRISELTRGRGLRQGMPLSPVLAFLFLADADLAVAGGFYRYVDDLLFFGPNRAEIESRFANYKASVEKRGLKIHDLGTPAVSPKTVLVGPNENFDFLGIRIMRSNQNIHFEIPPKSKSRIEGEISKSGRIDDHNIKNQKGWVLSSASRASNLVRNYHGAYHICSDWSSFERTLKQLQLNMCRTIVDELSRVKKSSDTELLRRLFGI